MVGKPFPHLAKIEVRQLLKAMTRLGGVFNIIPTNKINQKRTHL